MSKKDLTSMGPPPTCQSCSEWQIGQLFSQTTFLLIIFSPLCRPGIERHKGVFSRAPNYRRWKVCVYQEIISFLQIFYGYYFCFLSRYLVQFWWSIINGWRQLKRRLCGSNRQLYLRLNGFLVLVSEDLSFNETHLVIQNAKRQNVKFLI